MNREEILYLYRIYTDSFHEYAKIIWQFPTALVTINILGLIQEDENLIVYSTLFIINFVFLIFVFPRHTANQKSLRDQLVKLEQEIYVEHDELRPQFRKPLFTSTFMIFLTLFLLNLTLGVYILKKIV